MDANATDKSRRQFGEHAATYATSRPHAKGASLPRLVEACEPHPDWRVLDIATGAGHVALAFSPLVAEVVATDVTPQMLVVAEKLAAEKGLANMSFREVEASLLPFADMSFDCVTCRLAAHHFGDAPKFMHEVARVLKPGGRFGLVDNISPDETMMPGKPTALSGAANEYNAFEKLRDPSHGRCLTVTEWRVLVADAGLTVAHEELIDKDMALNAWADQVKIGPEIKGRLRAMLLDGSDEMRAFIRPAEADGDMSFVLKELLLVAEKT